MDGGLRQHATLCPADDQSDCSTVPICTGSGPNEAGCVVTTLDHYTTSFTWAQKNFDLPAMSSRRIRKIR
jgi:hypothetical protein